MDFIRHVKPSSKMLSNQYILIIIDYATKWVEVRTFYTNIVAITTKFLYEHILRRFGCLLTIVTNQGTHLINDAIRYLIDHFILRHTNYIIYGQAETINKVFGNLLTNLVNENRNDWD